MQVHKVIITIIDLDEVGADEIVEVIENTHYPNRCINPHVFTIETVEIGEWNDDHPLNSTDNKEVWKSIFPSLS